MITKKRYEMLTEASRMGADLAPVDYNDIEEYEQAHLAVQKQIKPKGKGRNIGKLVMQDIKQRMKVGKETYGEALRAFNGRDALLDAYQESLDLAMYLRQCIEERVK